MGRSSTGQKKQKLGVVVPTFKNTRPNRARSRPKWLKDAIDEKTLKKFDPDIDQLVVEEQYDNDDFDWLPNVPGRPAPYTTTWNVVYGHRVLSGKGFTIPCQEGCGKDIELDSHLHEVNAGSTPHGKPRKPPVCHNVSWAALEVSMLNKESAESSLRKKPAHLTPDFVRAVCWETTNLRPGHNACNALGTKTTAQNVSPQELKAAEQVIDTVTNRWFGSIWQL